MRTRASSLLAALAASALLSCERPSDPVACIAIAYAGITVTVTDAATGAPICDATVVLTAGGYREVLNPIPPSGTCAYSGAYERPGVYQVEASRPGYHPAAAGPVTVEMSRGDCPHVITQRVTLMLRPGV